MVECNLQKAFAVLVRLRKGIEQNHIITGGGTEVYFRISAGVAHLADGKENWESVMRRAAEEDLERNLL